MASRFSKPHLQEAKLTFHKGMSFCRTFRITNPVGMSFDFSDEDIRGWFRSDNKCYCPETEFCVETVNNCSTIEMFVDARITEKLKPCVPLFFGIDLNPRPPLESLDRPLKIMEVENYLVDKDLPISTYTNFKDIEPLLDHKGSFPLVRGTIRVEV